MSIIYGGGIRTLFRPELFPKRTEISGKFFAKKSGRVAKTTGGVPINSPDCVRHFFNVQIFNDDRKTESESVQLGCNGRFADWTRVRSDSR